MLLLPLALLVDRPWTLPHGVERGDLGDWWRSRCSPPSLAYLIYFRILNRAGATNALLVTFLIPVSAILLGLLLLDEGSTRGSSPAWLRSASASPRSTAGRRAACSRSSAARRRENFSGAAR